MKSLVFGSGTVRVRPDPLFGPISFMQKNVTVCPYLQKYIDVIAQALEGI
jgi:hypothetical protein